MVKGKKSWSPQEQIFSCQEFSSFFPLNGPEQILFSLFQVSSFRMNYGSALAWPQEDARKVPGQSRGVGALSGTFPGTPLRTAQGRGVRLEPPDGFCPEKRAWGSGQRPLPPAPGSRPPLAEPTRAAAAASTHRVRRWAGPLGTRTAAPRRRLGPPHALRAAARPAARSSAAAAAASPPWRGKAADGRLGGRR